MHHERGWKSSCAVGGGGGGGVVTLADDWGMQWVVLDGFLGETIQALNTYGPAEFRQTPTMSSNLQTSLHPNSDTPHIPEHRCPGDGRTIVSADAAL